MDQSIKFDKIISDEDSVANIAGSTTIIHVDRLSQFPVNAITKGRKNVSAAIKLSTESNASK